MVVNTIKNVFCQKPSNTPAASKPKSNPWNSTEEEFPTLQGVKGSRPLGQGWHLKKPEPKPAPKFINNSRPTAALNLAADFPTLGMLAVQKGIAPFTSISSW
jgi:hypothetical protein